jgi:1-aminocyclopropane-1-carboxylate deaminase
MNHGPQEKLSSSLRLPSPAEPLSAPAQPLSAPAQPLSDDFLHELGIRIVLKRDDLIHPEISGNKWRKLKYNLAAAADDRSGVILTFGGAYSNHIRATAAAGYHCGFSTIGIIRGEEHLPLNPSLAYAVSRGMRLSYMDRATYRRKADPDVIDALRRQFGSFYLVPEGGSNELAVRGCSELPAEIEREFDIICCPCGTGGTLAGIAAGLKPGQRALGFSALRGGEFLAGEVAELQRRTFGRCSDNWSIETRYHFGGFARRTPELDAFIADFRKQHELHLEWVYVAKMMYGLYSLIKKRKFNPGTRIIAVITGPPASDQSANSRDIPRCP